jgi:hypothetical protein
VQVDLPGFVSVMEPRLLLAGKSRHNFAFEHACGERLGWVVERQPARRRPSRTALTSLKPSAGLARFRSIATVT